MNDLQLIQALANIDLNTLEGFEAKFIPSVQEQFNKKGALSDKQWAIVERIVTARCETPINFANEEVEALYNFFFTARESIKYPKITITMDNGETLRIKMSGERSKQPDILQLEVAGAWVGRILPDGRLDKARSADWETVASWLSDLLADTPEFVASHGKSTGNCVFCHKPLTDDRSVANGYGKKCASNYGLEW